MNPMNELSKLAGRDEWVMPPERIIQRALYNGLLSLDEAESKAVKDAARSVAEDLRDSWPEGEGFGTSDGTEMVRRMLNEAGLDADFKNNRLVRLPKKEAKEAAIEEDDSKKAWCPECGEAFKVINGKLKVHDGPGGIRCTGSKAPVKSAAQDPMETLTRLATGVADFKVEKFKSETVGVNGWKVNCTVTTTEPTMRGFMKTVHGLHDALNADDQWATDAVNAGAFTRALIARFGEELEYTLSMAVVDRLDGEDIGFPEAHVEPKSLKVQYPPHFEAGKAHLTVEATVKVPSEGKMTLKSAALSVDAMLEELATSKLPGDPEGTKSEEYEQTAYNKEKPQPVDETDGKNPLKSVEGSVRSASLTIGKQDKAVIDAFIDQKPAEGYKLVTDGKRIDGLWMGGNNISEWVGGKIRHTDLGSKAAETVHKAIDRAAPANLLAKTAHWDEGYPCDDCPPDIVEKKAAERNLKNAAKGRDTHLPGKEGHTLCGEEAHKETLVDSVSDATCHYCRLAWQREHGGISDFMKSAAKGLYGFPRGVQSTCEKCIGRLTSRATKIARTAWQKDNDVSGFLQAHAKRADSIPAKILMAAMKGLGPQIKDEEEEDKDQPRMAGKNGLYGYKPKTANIGLTSCSQLREAAGDLAASLHGRRVDKHSAITGFLARHANEGKCLYSNLLNSCYPESEMRAKSAAEEWITWDKTASYKVHEFDSTGEAYDACQSDAMKDGEVLVIPSEKVVGVSDTWPFAVTEESGDLHHLLDPAAGPSPSGKPVRITGWHNAREEAKKRGWPLAGNATGAGESGKITVTYQSIDGVRKVEKFDKVEDARKFAQKWVGETPEIGSTYAVSGDGVGKVTVSGASLKDLFPRTASVKTDDLDTLNRLAIKGAVRGS